MSFIPKSSYSKNELIDCSNGKLFTKSGDGRLPSDNMLMFDEIVEILMILAESLAKAVLLLI